MESNTIDKMAYTIDQVSDLVNIGKTKLYAEIKAGRLKVRKCGTRTLVFRESLQEFLASLPASTPVPDYSNN